MSAATPSADDLRIFARVARLSSFTRAAHQLGLPRATVSTAVLRLEARLGARLLQRTTRRVQLTREGDDFLARCESVLADLEELGTLFQHPDGPLSGLLRVDMPLGMSTGPVMARLPEFLARHPGLQVQLSSTDRRVDVIAEGHDCVIRTGAVVDESLAFRPLGTLELCNAASLAYLARHGRPRSPEALDVHWLVDYRPNPGDAPAQFEYATHGPGSVRQVPMRHRVSVNNSAAYEAACRAGLGIAQLPVGVLAEGRAGDLVPILADWRPPPMPIQLLFPHRRQLPGRVRAFANWVAEVLQAGP